MPLSLMTVAVMATQSFGQSIRMGLRSQLYRTRRRLWMPVRIDGKGTYGIFRETRNRFPAPEEPVVLVVGFRLKFIAAWQPAHWLFQRVCIITTPFWGGLPGFSVKLWMVDQQTKNYLGIYDWRGLPHAQRYIDALIPVLKAVSTKGSVWHQILPGQKLEDYLERQKEAEGKLEEVL